ncbi:hypothetical protein DL98DRAFT_514228 [Cadophora sp. DSE1049]|nr:hypothetical protein DL98DRAFT_514228 [Cadophora sp. DSE1049]
MRPQPARMFFPPELWPKDRPRRPTTLRFQRAFPRFSRPVLLIAEFWPVWSGFLIFFRSPRREEIFSSAGMHAEGEGRRRHWSST